MARKLNIPIAIIGGLAAGLADPVGRILDGNLSGAMKLVSMRYTGFNPEDGKFYIEALKKGVVPLIAGILIHKFVGGAPLNVNKALANAGVPIIRI